MEDIYEKMSVQVDSENGSTNPVIVNKSEKDKYQLMADDLDKEELMKKIKAGEPITFGDLSWGKTIKESLNNLPSDYLPGAAEYISGIYSVLRHPYENAIKPMTRLATGVLKSQALSGVDPILTMSGIPTSPDIPMQITEQKEYAQKNKDVDLLTLFGAEQELYNTFGTEESLKKYLITHPFDSLMNISAILLPLLKVGELSTVGKTSKILNKIGKTVGMVDPINLAAKGAGFINPLKGAPESLHMRALELYRTIPIKRSEQLIEVAKKDWLTSKIGSVDKLVEQIKQIEDVKSRMIAAVPITQKMPIDEMFKYLDDYEKTIMETSLTGKDIHPIIEKMKKSILDAESDLNRTGLTANEVSARKVRANKELNDFFEKVVTSSEAMPFKKEVGALIDKSLKETLQVMVPEAGLLAFPKLSKKIIKKMFPDSPTIKLEQLNNIEGKLIELRSAISEEVRSIKTGEVMAFRVGQKAATGTWGGMLVGGGIGYSVGNSADAALLGGKIGGAIGLSIGIIDSKPRIKMTLGNYLNALRAAGIIVRPTATLIRMGLYEQSKLPDPNDSF